MSEQVKVFKNVNNVTPTSLVDSFDIPLLTTTATQRAVIKDVSTAGFVNEPGVTLDLDGFTVATGMNMEHDGNLIMDPSSVLKLRVEEATNGSMYVGGEFYGMFFGEGSTGMQYLTGSGDDISISPTKITSSSQTCDNAVAAAIDGVLFFYKQYSNNMYKYNAAGSQNASYSIPSTSYQSTTDGTYLYASYSSGSGITQYYKLPLNAASGTSFSTIPISGTGYYSPQANQGSYFLYHEGKIYTRSQGGSDYMSIIDLSTNTVTTTNHTNFSVGSYSDGACVVTTLAGKSYIVEQGQSYWSYYDIEADTVTRIAEGSSSSTEYGNGGGEIAPGVALIFGEQSDRIAIIDMNTKTRTEDTGSHGYTTDYEYGNRFAFAAYLDNKSIETYTYDAYVSGVLIEE